MTNKKGFIHIGIVVLIGLSLAVTGIIVLDQKLKDSQMFGASVSNLFRNILPELDSTYELGTSTLAWKNAYIDRICLAGDCQTSWSAGAGETNTASSLGTGLNIFDSKSGVDLRFNTLEAGSNITLSTTTDDNTIVIASTASGGGSGTVSTSTGETQGNLSFWTSTNATPALLGKVATTTLTASSPLSLSATVAKVGGSNSVLTIDTSGAWSGTAGSLATNGGN